VIPVPLPRPRDANIRIRHPVFLDLKQQVSGLLGDHPQSSSVEAAH
jgi:hypothetical protein